MSGFFITLDGPDGSGKSTQARWLTRALRKRGYRVIFVRDPGSTALGRRLRQVLLQESHHIRTRKVLRRMPQQTPVQRLQRCRRTKGHVRRPFRLLRRPVIVPQL